MKQLIIWVAFATFFIEIHAEKFSCEGRASGYYADLNTGCQVYHMCDGLGRQFSYSCPNTTLFQQRMLICDHWYMVNCSKSEVDYKANLLIGQKDKPFVEDSSEHPYHRTPRPDLLQQPYAPNYQNEEYRQGRAQGLPSSLNLVGVVTDDDAEDEFGNRKNFTTDRPQYFLPSHWSTQYGKYVTTPIPPVQRTPPPKPSKSNNQPITGNGKSSAAPEKKSPISDFKDFKDVKNRDVPPRKQPLPNFNNQKFLKVPPKVIQPPPSNSVSINPRIDNIPDSVNQESVSPSTLALPPFVPPPQVVRNPPVNQKPNSFSAPPPVGNVDISNIPKPSIFYQPPKFETALPVESSTMDPESFYKLIPSKDLLPPPLVPPASLVGVGADGAGKNSKGQQQPKQQPQQSNQQPNQQKQQSNQQPNQQKQQSNQQPNQQQQQSNQQPNQQIHDVDNSEKRWKELRQMFFIPEYDFPLETGSRPSYESGLSSFQVNMAPPIPEAFRRPPTPTGPTTSNGSRGINPECPKCDPAFLAPGTCKPCVMIR